MKFCKSLVYSLTNELAFLFFSSEWVDESHSFCLNQAARAPARPHPSTPQSLRGGSSLSFAPVILLFYRLHRLVVKKNVAPGQNRESYI